MHSISFIYTYMYIYIVLYIYIYIKYHIYVCMYVCYFFFLNFLYRYDTISTLQSYLDNQAMYYTDLGHQGIL